jgi:hypothetical protein
MHFFVTLSEKKEQDKKNHKPYDRWCFGFFEKTSPKKVTYFAT